MFSIGDNGTTCMRKNYEPSPAIYDPLAPSDPTKLDKLMDLLRTFNYDPLNHVLIRQYLPILTCV